MCSFARSFIDMFTYNVSKYCILALVTTFSKYLKMLSVRLKLIYAISDIEKELMKKGFFHIQSILITVYH